MLLVWVLCLDASQLVAHFVTVFARCSDSMSGMLNDLPLAQPAEDWPHSDVKSLRYLPNCIINSRLVDLVQLRNGKRQQESCSEGPRNAVYILELLEQRTKPKLIASASTVEGS